MLTPSTVVIVRGGTAQFSTTFFDFDGNAVNPQGAVVNIVYPLPGGGQETVAVNYTAPSAPSFVWVAQWDSRGAANGAVSCSVHTTGPGIPFAVEDFEFVLTANPANLVTF
jgi:hypothetical protein